MELRAGSKVWIPCEVKPGPFSNERLVRVRHVSGEWVGFVETSFLKEPVEQGQTSVFATVVAVEGNVFSARIPGQALDSNEVRGSTAQVSLIGALQA